MTINGNFWTTHAEWMAQVGPRHLVLGQEHRLEAGRCDEEAGKLERQGWRCGFSPAKRNALKAKTGSSLATSAGTFVAAPKQRELEWVWPARGWQSKELQDQGRLAMAWVHPILDALVPMGPDWVQDRILEWLRAQLLINDTELEIEVPKISSTSLPLRAVLSVTQMAAEQLEEVLVVSAAECVFNVLCRRLGMSWWKCRMSTVDIPVHGGVNWARAALQGSFPGQDVFSWSSAASSRGGLLGFPEDRVGTGFRGALWSRSRR